MSNPTLKPGAWIQLTRFQSETAKITQSEPLPPPSPVVVSRWRSRTCNWKPFSIHVPQKAFSRHKAKGQQWQQSLALLDQLLDHSEASASYCNFC